MPGTIQPQPLPAQGVQPADIAIAATVQLTRVGQATRAGAGQSGGVRIITADTFMASTDTAVLADTTASTVALRLPKVSEYTRMFGYVQRYAGANAFTVTPRGSDTIDGAGSLTVTKMVMLFPITNSVWHAVVIQP